MAELLVRAKKHWMDDLKQEDIDKMSESEKESYNSRSQIGDIIVVRSDGWSWGKCECLPDFVVIKIPGVKEEDVKHYESSLIANKDVVRTIEVSKSKYDSATNKATLFSSETVKVAPTIKEIKTDTYIVEATFENEYIKKRRKYYIDETMINNAVKAEKSVIDSDNKLTVQVKS